MSLPVSHNAVNCAEFYELVKCLICLVLLMYLLASGKVKVKFICIAHFMYKTIQSALHEIKALKICKRISVERNKIIKMNRNKQQSR